MSVIQPQLTQLIFLIINIKITMIMLFRYYDYIFQLPSSEAMHWLRQPHQGYMPRSWLRDTDIQNGDALLCFIVLLLIVITVNGASSRKSYILHQFSKHYTMNSSISSSLIRY